MDRIRMRILVVVAAKNGENPFSRRGKGSSTMFVSRGLVDPKVILNRDYRKGKQVNIPAPRQSLRASGRIWVS
jgi:hypothetical protein